MSVNKNNSYNASRRSFLLKGSMASVGLLMAGSAAWSKSFFEKVPNSKFFGVQIGVITYSYRSMPHNVEQLIQ